MPLTMQDVANLAGVSVSTVSIVLNDKPGVSPQTREAVTQAARDLNYRLPERHPGVGASASKTIAVVQYADMGSAHEEDPSGLPPRYMRGIQDFFRSHNVGLTVIANYREGNALNIAYPLLEEGLRYDGAILIQCPSRESTLLRRVLDEGSPAVAISRDWPALPISTVGQDHRQQAKLALDHLIRLGHRRIGLLAADSDRPYDWFHIRMGVYRETMESLNVWDQERVAIGPDAGRAALALLDRRPDTTAIFAISDVRAISAMEALGDAGLQVPQQVSITGLDDSRPTPEGYPGLTTVAFPHQAVGRLAAKTLMERIDSEDTMYSRVFVRSWLVERESSAEPRASAA